MCIIGIIGVEPDAPDLNDAEIDGIGRDHGQRSAIGGRDDVDKSNRRADDIDDRYSFCPGDR